MMQTVPTDLLLLSLRADLTPAEAALFAQLSAEEWGQLIEEAEHQRVHPLLFYSLKTRDQTALLPAAAWQHLQMLVYDNAKRNLHLSIELGKVLTVLCEHQIPVIVLKGAHLATTVYGQPALRSMHDIDLLVPQANVAEAATYLVELGYQPLTPSTLTAHWGIAHHLPRLVKTGDIVTELEIHWTISPPGNTYAIESEELWTRAAPLSVAGVTVQALCPEDLLLHLCFHASYHHLLLQGIRPLCDIDRTIRHYQNTIDWASLVERATAWRWQRGVYLVLYLAETLLATPLPADLMEQLLPVDFNTTLVHAAYTQLFAAPKTEKISSYFAQLWHGTSWVDKTRLLLRRFFLRPQELANLYGISVDSPYIHLYYLARIKDLLFRYLGKVWQLWCDDPQLVESTKRYNHLRRWLEQP